MVLLVNVLQAESINTLDPWSTPQCWGGKGSAAANSADW
jgi:hypothetical protein